MNKNKKWAASLLIFGAFVTICLLQAFSLTSTFENWILDKKFQKISKNVTADSSIALLYVDDASIAALDKTLGRWPWPRAVWEEVISYLREDGAKSMVFDILFSEYQKAKDSEGNLGPDDLGLVSATAASNDVIHATHVLEDNLDEINKELLDRPLPDYVKENFSLKDVNLPPSFVENNNSYFLPFEELAQNTSRIGVVEFTPDQDGVYRSSRLLRFYQKSWLPSLGLAPLINDNNEKISYKEGVLALGNYNIPLDDQGRFRINFKKKFNQFSISGLLATIQAKAQGKNDSIFLKGGEFKDKTVFIAVSAVGGNDLKLSPFGPNTPGVVLHATTLSNILERDYLKDIPNWSLFFIIFLFCWFTVSTILFMTNPLFQFAPTFLLAIVYGLASFYFFNQSRLILPLFLPLLAIIVSGISSYIFLALTEGRDKKKIKKMLSQYVSPAVLKEVMSKGEILSAGGGNKEIMTVLFSDVRSFTTFSENSSPEVVVEMLNFYLNEMVNTVFKFEGTIDKFIGDAVMAFWGAPVKTDDHALKAVRAAQEMLISLKKINIHFASQGRPPFAIGIGLNTGEVILGNIGSEKKLDYTVIGDNVNLSSRIEGLTKTYHSELLISESTYDLVKHEVPCKILDYVKVKGKNKPIAIYAPLLENENPELSSAYRTAFDYYLKKKFTEAINHYKEIIKIESYKGHLEYIQNMIDRCLYYQGNPPESDWDGSYTMKSK